MGEVVIGCKAEVIARHVRSYESDDMIFNPLHYLPLIERKIASLDQAAPLEGWKLPEELLKLRRLLEAPPKFLNWQSGQTRICADPAPAGDC